MLSINGLQKVVGTQTRLDIEAFAVSGGEIVAIVGPSGSGKSLLKDLILGQARPTMGKIQVGIDPDAAPDALSRYIGVLFENNGLYARHSVLENLRFQCKLFGLPLNRANEILQLVGLQEHKKTRGEALSTGFARRLAFGRALLHAPEMLLLIEPFAQCDEATIQLISRIIKQQARDGAAVLILAADETHLDDLCQSMYRLNRGRLSRIESLQQETASLYPFKIPVRLEGKIVLLNPVDILYIDADEGKTRIWTVNGELPSQFTLSELEQRLARSGFFRAHRSYLVNLQHVREVIPYTRNSFSLRLSDKGETKIPMSKAAAAELRDLLDY